MAPGGTRSVCSLFVLPAFNAGTGGQEVAAGIAGGGGGQPDGGKEPFEGRLVVLLPRFGSEAIGPTDQRRPRDDLGPREVRQPAAAAAANEW